MYAYIVTCDMWHVCGESYAMLTCEYEQQQEVIVKIQTR